MTSFQPEGIFHPELPMYAIDSINICLESHRAQCAFQFWSLVQVERNIRGNNVTYRDGSTFEQGKFVARSFQVHSDKVCTRWPNTACTISQTKKIMMTRKYSCQLSVYMGNVIWASFCIPVLFLFIGSQPSLVASRLFWAQNLFSALE